VFAAVFAGSLVVRSREHPDWTPSGSDWDQWYTSALALTAPMPFPQMRWPLNAWVILGVDTLGPGPLHVSAVLASLAVTALGAAGAARLGLRLLPAPAALTAVALAYAHPRVATLAGGIGPYPLWAAAAVCTVAALVEALATGSLVWWAACGLGWAAGMASIEKGVGIGLALGALLGLVAAVGLLRGPAAQRRAAWRPLVAFALPVAALVLAYATFTVPLWSLDDMIHLSLAPTSGVARAQPPGTSGWVFGQRMDPITLWNTLQLARSNTGAMATIGIEPLGGLRVPDGVLRGAVVLGAITAVVAGGAATRRLLARSGGRHEAGAEGTTRENPGIGSAAPIAAGWAGVGVILLATIPAALTTAVPQVRFLLPAFLVGPLLLFAPFALLPRRAAWLALLALPLCLHPRSPWAGSFWFAPASDARPSLIDDALFVRVYRDLERLAPGVPIDVAAPRTGGLFLLGERGGDPLPRPDLTGVKLTPERGIVFVVTGANFAVGAPATNLPVAPGAADLTGRTVLATWGTPDGALVYLGPVAP
jgi:hypothetical protein